MTNDKPNYNPAITDKREIQISFDVPFFSFIQGVYTTITQRDLLKIIRQVQDTKLKEQLKTMIQKIDELSEYKTDIDNQIISRKDEKPLRQVNGYKHDMRNAK